MIYDFTSVEKAKKKYTEFTKKIVGKKPIFAFIHADWCGHCQNIMPEWKSFLKRLKSKTINIGNVAVLDITDEAFSYILEHHPQEYFTDILRKYVVGYPTLFYMEDIKKDNFSETMVSSYSGNRTSDSFVDFINKHRPKKTSSKSTTLDKKKSKEVKDTKTKKTKEAKDTKKTKARTNEKKDTKKKVKK